MALRLAISGFGRIGRMVLRALVESGRDDVEIVLINTPGPVDASAHLYEFDSVHGRAQGSVTHGDGWMDVGRGRIAMTHERDPSAIPHAAHGIDIVLECSGHFNTRDKAAAHLDGGARRVLVSAPCKSPDATIVYGVNHHEITPDMLVISNASCTTNGLAPVAHVMAESVGIEAGYMTTIHA
ncbi:MAG TPA: erythrose-4-phosphate dehydrogenase, partial [Alphaproteobacteria bacterium]|nr:erythrose-4-phosphate dehydrogenase [Alphaproteobacteria bacterium]